MVNAVMSGALNYQFYLLISDGLIDIYKSHKLVLNGFVSICYFERNNLILPPF